MKRLRILTKDIHQEAAKGRHPGGPAIFIGKLIKSCYKQGIAEFTFDPSDDYDAVLDGTINLERTFTLDEINGFRESGKPFVLRLSGLGHKKHRERYVRENCVIIRNSSSVIYQTHYTKSAWLRSCGPSTVEGTPNTIIMNGDDPERFRAGPMIAHLPGMTFAAVASWGPPKKLDFIVELFKTLITQGLDVSLLLGGTFKDQVTLPPLEAAFKERIVFQGYVAPSDIPSFYASADAFIHARAGDWCPNAVVEALCAGLPGVVHSLGGTSELVGDAGIMFDEHDLTKASRAVMELMDNYRDYKQKVAGRIRLLDIDSVAQRYVDVMKRLVY